MVVSEPGSRQVLIRVKESVVSPGTEATAIRPAPQRPKGGGTGKTNHCVAGVIAKAGREIRRLKEGDRVIAME
jgi:NADPH:quinone reductase-like Zn-dependent oxidoreductase